MSNIKKYTYLLFVEFITNLQEYFYLIFILDYTSEIS